MWVRALALLAVLCGCPSKHPATPPPPPPPPPPLPQGGALTWQRVETAAAMPPAPAPGTYQIHLIDVGTGLSILIRGADFAMLYDAGSNDREEKPLRVAAYLAAS